MEKDFYTDEFEQLLKEKADQFRMYPSKRVWHSIYNNLHPSRRWPSVVMSLLLITSLMLIGYLHTGDNSITQPINYNAYNETSNTANTDLTQLNNKEITHVTKPSQQPMVYANAFEDVLTDETDFYTYTIVRNNRPNKLYNSATTAADAKLLTEKSKEENNGQELIEDVDSYIKSKKIFADIAVFNKKDKAANSKTTAKNTVTEDLPDPENNLNNFSAGNATSATPASNTNLTKINETEKKLNIITNAAEDKSVLTNEEKAWIENFAQQNKSSSNKWKNHLAFSFYATPAVNYRKISTNTKGSATPFANSDINNSISQKPGLGIETGLGLTYSIKNRLLIKAGFQFNYTNYNINADQTNHPILTTILLNDPNTGFSYSASRTSTTSNAYNSTALQPVKLHNTTYQISVPVGFAYKLSSQNNVDWFAGASVQPTYVFGGNAHIISSDLKSYISDPSSISTWNLNLGFETYMNFKLGTYKLQVGPQVRYQVYSTYRRSLALIEKPYAVGLKFGLTKNF